MPRGRKEPQSSQRSQPSQPDLTNSILARTSERYQAAERVRRDHGAAWMARQHGNAAEHGAVRLLIGTWDALARSFSASGGAPDPFFAINPFDLAWEALQPAVKILRQTDGPGFASEFEKLANRSRAWLKTEAGRRHRTMARHGKGKGKGHGGHGGGGGHGGNGDHDGNGDHGGDNGQGGGMFL